MPAPAISPGLYRHYKGRLYQVWQLAQHSETREWLVVYQALYGDYGWWVRPAAMFSEDVEVNGQRQPRFAAYTPHTETPDRV
ncbi:MULTISPECIES: DUF1653 domain-containing protein [unclassified Comamonas]|uniref:DUF1653 domain-containing protein n=1 Tax=unclassified Comamonas TaxID=2638500 RepID=UPI001EFB82F3|nr:MULTISPECIES: DUF1653 domain-containing protein [unclassified Comamonas]ULR89618.1 DUF1653 domain-containing protein [Comamonas sp. B21-038]